MAPVGAHHDHLRVDVDHEPVDLVVGVSLDEVG